MGSHAEYDPHIRLKANAQDPAGGEPSHPLQDTGLLPAADLERSALDGT